MDWVKIRHPVTGGEATVPASSMGEWAGAGWLLAGDDTEGQPAQPPAGGSEDKPAQPRRRRNQEGG